MQLGLLPFEPDIRPDIATIRTSPRLSDTQGGESPTSVPPFRSFIAIPSASRHPVKLS